MIYREAGQFKVSYQEDQETFPIRFDKVAFWLSIFIVAAVIPFFVNDYWEKSVFLPFFIYSIAAIGLNILTGYCGQVSLGTGGFMAVGAYTSYKLMTSFPGLDMFIVIVGSGLMTAAVGMLFGIPSLRIKGFYLAVATLAAQFFLVWLFNKWEWTYNYSATGQITAPQRDFLGIVVTGAYSKPWATYLFCFAFLFVFAWLARNLVRGHIGRSWMAIRDMDIAAEIIGVNPLKAKLSAFAISSFYIGIAGGLYFSVWLGAAEPTEAFSIDKSFDVLFMIIIGGLGSMIGSIIGAAFIVLLPVFFKTTLVGILGWPTDIAEFSQIILIGSLIIFFLIKEPHGIAALWRTLKEKLRLWPFPY
ncbi:MAG: branched-chain amino acid ABC transporter permease [Pseudomonadota bacterium]|nr:branched-chain amino acid ABC transporter permease [Pseudomonadota bacterium]